MFKREVSAIALGDKGRQSVINNSAGSDSYRRSRLGGKSSSQSKAVDCEKHTGQEKRVEGVPEVAGDGEGRGRNAPSQKLQQGKEIKYCEKKQQL